MYLKNIKLAGFKSFVDPTTIPISGSLSAIVGPNGCGKSNIVDAIRWVIGETSAKQLRGQTMSDVIFNGTSARKPVGRASIELHFDNSAGKIAGEYAKYAEIAIRREVGRDGQSGYFVNGTQVRRRDVVDVFLGTGLGSRSYAIIEQGMISSLIEAKPEQLRVYIEEAAGISKYRERRRETETRMRHTQENLDRINDIREELAKQLRRLKRQANAAERYKVHKQEERLLAAQIKALQWQAFEKELQHQDKLINDQDLLREEQRAEQRHVETGIERARVQQTEATETQNEVQKRYYGLGADIARLEQRIKDTQEQTQQWQKEFEENEGLWQELSDNAEECQTQITTLEAELERLNPQTTDVQAVADAAQQALAKAEADMNRWQEQWDAFQEEASQAASQVEVSRTKIEHYQQQLNDLKNRAHQSQENLDQLQLDNLRAEIAPLGEQSNELNQQLDTAKTKLQNYAEQIAAQRQTNYSANDQLQGTRRDLQALEARSVSLEALQKTALGHNDEQANAWLSKHDLKTHSRLAQHVRVNAGWELAVETVFSSYFDAVCVGDLDKYINAMTELSQGNVTLLEKPKSSPEKSSSGAPTLADQVESDWLFHQWLTEIYIADDLAEAKRLRTQLSGHESVITRDGVWLGANWIRVCKPADAEEGVLVRKQQLEELTRQIASQQEKLNAAETALSQGEATLNQLETERDADHQAYQALSTESMDVQKQLSAKQTHLDDAEQRQTRLQQALASCQQQVESTDNELQAAQTQLQTLMNQQQSHATRREQLTEERDQFRGALENQRAETQRKQQQADELEIRLAANQDQLTLLRQTVQRDERQLKQLGERREVLSENLADTDTPLESMNKELQGQLDKRLSVERELRSAEQQVESNNQKLKSLETQRNALQDQLGNFQEKLEELRMQRREITVRQATIKEQLNEVDLMLEAIVAELPEEAEIKAWEERLDQVAQQIQRLGPINLAAIEEYDTTSERKDYLDKQEADLTEALSILETAIRKIDRESREKFRNTFDRINNEFQKIFPRIFGGGRAYLDLTDDDLLTTGVLVRAQPPGKRNVTIHMLSGGEKALTAISLVFAMFQLNPAPFCILDEVDAPLDDINVGRFCQLVKEMAKETQFLVISHNKVTIEMADHLMGVTMQEPGVSRIVSVDMQKAMEMVEAA